MTTVRFLYISKNIRFDRKYVHYSEHENNWQKLYEFLWRWTFHSHFFHSSSNMWTIAIAIVVLGAKKRCKRQERPCQESIGLSAICLAWVTLTWWCHLLRTRSNKVTNARFVNFSVNVSTERLFTVGAQCCSRSWSIMDFIFTQSPISGSLWYQHSEEKPKNVFPQALIKCRPEEGPRCEVLLDYNLQRDGH